jgi:hypothetical protein
MFQSTLYKKFLALVITIFIVGSGVSAYLFFNKTQLGVTPTKEGEVSTVLSDEANQAFNNLKKTISNTNPGSLVYQEIELDNLQVYPNSWIGRNFTTGQQGNKLISGSEADPDKDGLSNRQEFLYGSNPMTTSTYCGVQTQTLDTICPKNDKEMIDAKLNPLTGLSLEIKKKFRAKIIDKNIAENLETSLNTSSDQGFDFPKLYEESRKLNLTDEFSKIKILTQKDTGDGVLTYYKSRLDILKEFAQDDELSSFNNLYGVIEVDKLTILKTKYENIESKLSQAVVPELVADYHKANVMVIQKMITILNGRIDTLTKNKLQTKEETEKSQKLAQEMLWSYRNLNDQQVKLQAKLERDYPTIPSSAQ